MTGQLTARTATTSVALGDADLVVEVDYAGGEMWEVHLVAPTADIELPLERS